MKTRVVVLDLSVVDLSLVFCAGKSKKYEVFLCLNSQCSILVLLESLKKVIENQGNWGSSSVLKELTGVRRIQRKRTIKFWFYDGRSDCLFWCYLNIDEMILQPLQGPLFAFWDSLMTAWEVLSWVLFKGTTWTCVLRLWSRILRHL